MAHTVRTCTHDGCDKPHRARGYCSTHYNQLIAPDRHAKVQVPCANCGTPTWKNKTNSKKRRPTCSNECRAALPRTKPPASCKLPPDHWARWYGRTSQWPRFGWGTCDWCEARFPLRSRRSRYCTTSCNYKALDAARGVTPRHITAALNRNCARCRSAYRSEHQGRKHCSDLCRDLDAKERGTQLYHGWIRTAERMAIYERDNYTCWICNKKCDPDVDAQTHDDAPTLDHLIPRSKGGTHEWSNLRTACRICNSLRGAADAETLTS